MSLTTTDIIARAVESKLPYGGKWDEAPPERQDMCQQAAQAVERALDETGLKIVPWEPTHLMERGYFTAPLPKFKVETSANKRRKNNRQKMVSRWQAMILEWEKRDGQETIP